MQTLLQYYEGNEFSDEIEENLLQDFIMKYCNQLEFQDQEFEVIFKKISTDRVMANCPVNLQLKILQILRLLTRDKNLQQQISNLSIFFQNLHNILLNNQEEINIQIEIVNILNRFIKKQEFQPYIIADNFFDDILCLFNQDSPILLKSLFDFLINILDSPKKQQFIEKIAKIQIISKLMQIYFNQDFQFKIQILSIISKIIDEEIISNIFIKMNRLGSILMDLNKNNLTLNIAILHCINKLIQNGWEMRGFNLIKTLSQNIENSKSFMEIISIFNIYYNLCMKDDLSERIAHKSLPGILKILYKSHDQQIEFIDIQENQKQDCIYELQLHCFKILRYLYSCKQNQKTFNGILPQKIFSIFLDVGNYQKSLSKYQKIQKRFQELNKQELEHIKIEQENTNDNHSQISNISLLGKYQIQDTIGKGAFGTVYTVQKGQNKYALKVIPLGNLDEQKNKNNYLKEVQIYEQLNHPSIVQYYESFIQNEKLCIAMEYVRGFNLSELIKIKTEKNMVFSEIQIWKIIVNICSALKYLHVNKRIVHRDLNPSNIMIDKNYAIKLVDFGLSKNLQNSGQLMNSFVGTLVYTCPEIVQNQHYDDKADIWSLGCIVYELLTLKQPFTSNNPLMLAKKIVDNDCQLDLIKNYSQDLVDLVKVCLQHHQSRPNIQQVNIYNKDYYTDILKNIRITRTFLEQRNSTSYFIKLNQYVFLILLEIIKLSNKLIYVKIILQILFILEFVNEDKIQEDDPVQKMLEMVQKLGRIWNRKGIESEKKFWVDLFYEKVVLNENQHIKQEIHNLCILNQDPIKILDQHFLKISNQQQQLVITYEKLNYYVDDLLKNIEQ